MRIVYLHQYFNTPAMDGGTRSFEFARRMVAAGHQVEMITTARDSTNATDWRVTDEAGIRVHWLPVPYSNHMGTRDRIWSFGRFALGAARHAAKVGGDVVFATSTPLTIAIPALLASWRMRVPMVFEVRDLWPEAPAQLGALTNPLLLAAARMLERAAYRGSDHVVALSPGMRDGVVAAGVRTSKVSVIPNASDLELFHPGTDGSSHRDAWGAQGRFVLGYFGTMGLANGLDLVLDAARVLLQRGVEAPLFVLHGDGKERPRLEQRRRDEGLHNVIFSGPSGKATMPSLFAATDVCMTIFANYPILRTCSPNKMFDGLAAGRPILTNTPGWLSDLLTSNGCGVAVRPDDPLDMADKIQELTVNPRRVSAMGRAARVLAERDFSRDRLADDVLRVLEDAVWDSSRTSRSRRAAAVPVSRPVHIERAR